MARYAWGSDYHAALKERLQLLVEFLAQRVAGEIRARMLVGAGGLMAVAQLAPEGVA